MAKPLKSLFGIFFEEEEETTTTDTVATEEVASEPTPTAVPSAVVTPQVSAPSVTASAIIGGVNEEMAGMLMAAIEEANLPGFDYLEFRDAVNKMANTGMTESNKFLAIFTTASSMGLTRETLLASIDHYVSVINEKREGFMAHVADLMATEVDGRHEQAAKLDEEIASAAEEIAALNQKIQESQHAKINLQNEANTEKMNIENTRASFEATFNMVLNKLESDRTSIMNYIPDPSASSSATATPSQGE